ncbi:unnamed protein product [Euphydryas editha]|uniref:Uncharacterized protein n=1 Tax=Euphydryas editha TaxID=104508 RepID=A0AAU9UL97_EUPED|nr:unnamed protein product [Euphydryas editha]
MSSESSSESELGPCSSKFDAQKVLYAEKPVVPVKNAPLYENLQQFEAAIMYESLKKSSIISVGKHELVQKREEEKERKKKEEERLLEEKNKQRFAKYEGLVPTKRSLKKVKNVMTRIETMTGPLGALKDCVDQRLRIKRYIIRNDVTFSVSNVFRSENSCITSVFHDIASFARIVLLVSLLADNHNAVYESR